MSIKNVVFDLGGVIMDLNREQAVQRFEALGVTDAEALIDPYEQNGLFLEIENGKLTADGFRQQLSQHAGRELTLDEIQHAWMGFVVDVPAYKLDYLLELRKRNFDVYILSNTNPFIMDRWARTSTFTDAGRSLAEYCNKIYASFEIGVTKPDPYIFEYMLKDSGMKPKETLFIDDGLRNIEVASALGIQTYHAKNKEDWREAVEKIMSYEL